LPSWYDEVKFGIFIHWGVYAVPSFGCHYNATGGGSAEWYWWFWEGDHFPCNVAFHNKTYGAHFTYQDFAPMWHAELFDPDYWAQVFNQSGAKYVVFTSKHHEGFTNWQSPQSWNLNSVDNGPHIDIVSALRDSIVNAGLHFGLYHSLFEWFNPLYLQDRIDNTTIYVDTVLRPQLYDIVNRFKPELIWSDGDWDMPDSYWDSKNFLAWLYNDSPVKDVVVVNDRWGNGDMCVHGGYWTCADRYNPGHLIQHKWENAMTIDMYSWGNRRNMIFDEVLTTKTLLVELITTVAYGGNLLLNVGPRAEGTLDPIFVERLLEMGKWLDINGNAIYNTKPWRAQNESDYAFYTSNQNTIYCIVVEWPESGHLVLTEPIPGKNPQISMMGFGTLPFNPIPGKTLVDFTGIPFVDMPSRHAWTLVLTGFS